MSLLFASVATCVSLFFYPLNHPLSITKVTVDRTIFARGSMRSSVATVLIFGFHQIKENITY